MEQEDELIVLTIDEIIESKNLNFLNECMEAFKEAELYENCARIRDRVTELTKDDNSTVS